MLDYRLSMLVSYRSLFILFCMADAPKKIYPGIGGGQHMDLTL